MAGDPPLIMWGRCRSGRRWFWTASVYGGNSLHGWADSPADASRQANAATVQLAAGRYADVRILHGVASDQLKKVNTSKRAAKGPSKPKRGPQGHTPPPKPVGWLYAIEPGRYELDDVTWVAGKVVRLPITKKTTKRIYYLRPRYLHQSGPDWQPGYVDRQHLERYGSAHAPGWLVLFAEPPEIPKPAARTDLKSLKAAMAAAHPDRGGTSETFIAARARYLRAKTRAA